MRFIAFTLGPVFRSKLAGTLTVLMLVAGPIFGAVIGVKHVIPRARGWHTTTAIVVRPGNKPASEENQNETRSVVTYHANGETREKTLYLAWYKREGAHVHLWVKGTATRQSSPTGFFVLVRRPILWALFGLAVSVALLLLSMKVEEAIENYDKAVETKRAEREDANRAAPESLEALVQLCNEHGDCVVTLNEAHSYGPCMWGVRKFRDQEFPGRLSITLAELAPFLIDVEKKPQEDWWHICHVAVGKLKALGVIKQKYDAGRLHYPPPSADRAEELETV